MNHGGSAFQCLHQVWFDGVFQQDEDGACSTQVLHGEGRAIVFVSQQNGINAIAQVFQAGAQTQDRHDFRRWRNVESSFRWNSVCRTTHAAIDHTQTAIVHVHYPAPQNSLQAIGCALIVVVVVIEQCSDGVVGRSNGVEITGEVQVDVFHGKHLGISAPCSSAFHPETRS